MRKNSFVGTLTYLHEAKIRNRYALLELLKFFSFPYFFYLHLVTIFYVEVKNIIIIYLLFLNELTFIILIITSEDTVLSAA